MIWEYLVLTIAVIWALAYLWKIFIRKKGCSCDSCPGADSLDCGSCSTENHILEDFQEKDSGSDHKDK
ncbi:MAG: hypothetical protein ABR542_09845, partial [Desulfonatronovibrio sp.]